MLSPHNAPLAADTTYRLSSYPVLSATDAKTSKILLIIVIALHAGLAIAIKILFFAFVPPSSPPFPTQTLYVLTNKLIPTYEKI